MTDNPNIYLELIKVTGWHLLQEDTFQDREEWVSFWFAGHTQSGRIIQLILRNDSNIFTEEDAAYQLIELLSAKERS